MMTKKMGQGYNLLFLIIFIIYYEVGNEIRNNLSDLRLIELVKVFTEFQPISSTCKYLPPGTSVPSSLLSSNF